MIFRIKITFVFLFFGLNLFNQGVTKKQIDSLINDYEKSQSINLDDREKISSFCLIIDSLSNKINYAHGIFYSNLILVEVNKNFSEDNNERSIKKLDSLVINKVPVKESFLVRYYLNKGNTEGVKGNLFEELKFYLKADSICEKSLDNNARKYIKHYIAAYYIDTKEYLKALKEVNEAIHLTNKKEGFYLSLLQQKGSVFFELNEIDSAIYYFKKSIEMGIGKLYNSLSYEYYSLGKFYSEINKLDSAKKYLFLSKSEFDKELEYSIDGVKVYEGIGKLFHLLNQFDSSVYYYDLSLKIADSINHIDGVFIAQKNIILNSLLNLSQGKLVESFERYNNLVDSVLFRSSFELEKKYIVENETLKKETKIKELELKKESDKNYRILLYWIFSVLLVIFLFIIQRYVSRQKILEQNLEIEEYKKNQVERNLKEKEKELASKINIIQSNIKVIEELKNKEVKSVNLTDITSVFEQNYISDVEWQNIALQFNEIHPNYINSIKEEDVSLTQNDIRLLILLKLEYSNQAIAEILNISVDGVKKAKYRLKKKVREMV